MLFWTGVVTTAFTIWMETLALKTLSAAETTLIFSTEPLFGTAFAAIVANECFGKEAAIGAAFIIGGCLVSGIDLNMRLPPMKWNRNEFGFQSKNSD
jgi:drug/metabolite transporter (DMT)-like permease